MKRILIILFSALPFLCISQDTTLYGLARGINPASLYFASMQPSTGIVTAVSNQLPDTMYSLNGSSAIDPVTDRYYYMSGTNTLRAIQISTGTPAASYNLNLPFGHYFEMMQYNCADSTIYALYRTSSPVEIRLCKFDPATNVITILSQNSFGFSFSVNAFTTIDPVNGIFYVITNTLTGISLATGNVVSAPQLIFPPNAQYLDMLVSKCENGMIYCLARNTSPPQLYLASVNPVSGLVSLISTLPVPAAGALNAGCEFYSPGNVFYTAGINSTWLGVSALTGNPVSSPVLSMPNNTVYFDLTGRNNCDCSSSNPKGIQENDQPELFSVFPSPVNSGGEITIRFSDFAAEKGRVNILNALGQIVATAEIADKVQTLTVSTGNLSAGYYSVLYQTEKVSVSKPFMVY